jgi:tRNA 2-selenouridine synthase
MAAEQNIAQPTPVGPPVQVRPIEFITFGEYNLIVDARSPREFSEDHIPSAVNLPVLNNDEYAEIGTTHGADPHRAYVVGVAYALRNMAAAIDRLIAQYPRQSKMLVYCFRGGKRSKLWHDALTTIGYRVDRLQGGWRAYRAWVRAQLAELPLSFRYHVLCGPTGCGKTRLLQALREMGAQVLDLEEIARHRGSLIGGIPGVPQPSQKYFESLLAAQLRRFDPARPVWLEAESRKIGALQLPPALFAAMHAGRVFPVEAPMPERVKLWREDYRHFEEDPRSLVGCLESLRPLVGGEEYEAWQNMAAAHQIPDLFERLMRVHYDPAYARSIERHYPQSVGAEPVVTPRLDPETLRGIAVALSARP